MLRLVGIHTDYDFEPGRKSRGRFHWYKLVGSSAKQLLFNQNRTCHSARPTGIRLQLKTQESRGK